MRAPSFTLALVVASTLVASSGCSAADRYGDSVRYAPSYRSYVLAPESGSDDPPRDELVVLLRDPVTERKIRCREELERWVTHYRRDAIDDADDETAQITSVILMAPATVIAALAVDVAVVGIGVAELPYQWARTEDAFSIYERGVDAFGREDWPETSRLLELALVKGQRDLSAYYLGIAYANMGRSDEAIEALTAFVERSSSQEVTAYRNAERWLRYLGEPVSPCISHEPMVIRW